MFFDHRMIEGSPLHYFPYYPNSPHGFTYFRRFEEVSRMSEDFMMPNSPNSTQSDSDASVSSIDIHPEPIQIKLSPNQTQRAESKCYWQNCGITFESLDRLSDHVSKVHAVSGPGGLYYCGWEGCTRNDKGFNARYKMLVHVRTHTNEKPHRCSLCQKSFSRAENLKIHVRSHSGERPYACPVPGCGKAYSNSSDRFKHTRTHQVDKPYQCKVPGCTKRYTDPSSLRKHVKTYKHFVNDNNQINENQISKGTKETAKMDDLKSYQNHQTLEGNGGNSCYLSCIEMNGYEIKPQWNIIEPYCVSYQFKENQMEVDGPLDLSVGRRHV